MKLKPFKTIGIGATFSPNLEANLYEASRLAMLFDSKLILIHVGESSDDKKVKFQSILQPFIEKGLDYDIVFKPGKPVDVILSITSSYNIDLLLIGALKRENFVKFYLGSIARQITRKALCSVLLLTHSSVDNKPCKHIVVNGLKDPKTKETICLSFYMATNFKAKKMTIVEEIAQQEVAVSVEDDKSLRRANINKERIKLREDSRVKKLIEDIDEQYTSSVNYNIQPIFGKRGYSIGHYAEVVRADLLIMNAPDKTSFLDRLFPHDIEHILTELPTDVLIVR
ncbi:MAG: universal stress protein UspA [Bacteroidetes bacterium MedPE-SWsnd-G2]|nr:MAG: universal stress protein UspA [Bacteroidetes bacterium MedPE-SWsnd-G2]